MTGVAIAGLRRIKVAGAVPASERGVRRQMCCDDCPTEIRIAFDFCPVTTMEADVPESLLIEVESRHHEAVRAWWHALSDDQRAAFSAAAFMESEEIFNCIPTEDEPDFEANEWYEYLVNQDLRFYFDRAHPQGNYNVVYPIIAPISSASDVAVVSHLLKR
jgi:hypothetical protein